MTLRALWLADVLLAGNLPVVEVDGWQDRGNATLDPQGIVGHHTAGGTTGEIPSLRILRDGRPDLTGPLCNLGLARSGVYYVVASGKANHAGLGGWRGVSGNSHMLGIEAENDGHQPWPAAQIDSYVRGSAALLAAMGAGSSMWCRHHEWRAEKPDPHDIDGDDFRASIQTVIDGTYPKPQQTDAKTLEAILMAGDAVQVRLADSDHGNHNAVFLLSAGNKPQYVESEYLRDWLFNAHVATRHPNATTNPDGCHRVVRGVLDFFARDALDSDALTKRLAA